MTTTLPVSSKRRRDEEEDEEDEVDAMDDVDLDLSRMNFEKPNTPKRQRSTLYQPNELDIGGEPTMHYLMNRDGAIVSFSIVKPHLVVMAQVIGGRVFEATEDSMALQDWELFDRWRPYLVDRYFDMGLRYTNNPSTKRFPTLKAAVDMFTKKVETAAANKQWYADEVRLRELYNDSPYCLSFEKFVSRENMTISRFVRDQEVTGPLSIVWRASRRPPANRYEYFRQSDGSFPTLGEWRDMIEMGKVPTMTRWD
jgi:hypothetical protein